MIENVLFPVPKLKRRQKGNLSSSLCKIDFSAKQAIDL